MQEDQLFVRGQCRRLLGCKSSLEDTVQGRYMCVPLSSHARST